jgi:hypothetical protein
MRCNHRLARDLTLGGLLAMLATECRAATTAANVEWSRQISTQLNDFASGVSTDGMGNVYLTGLHANNRFSPVPPLNAFVSRFNASGTLQWLSVIDSGGIEFGTSIAADRLGNVFVTGHTDGNLFGQNAGGSDGFLMNYNPGGGRRWAVQFGSSAGEEGHSVAADGLGSAYLTGDIAGDLFLRKYDAAGSLLWSRTIVPDGSGGGSAVTIDRLGNVFVTGGTTGDLGGINSGSFDAFLTKFDINGNLQWTRQLGSPGNDQATGVSGDGLGNVYISGITDSDLAAPNAGGFDAFLAKYDALGNLLWKRQYGAEGTDGAGGISADPFGNIYVSGGSPGHAMPGPTVGTGGIFLSKFDPSGNRLWTRQFSGLFDDGGNHAVDGSGAIYVSGLVQNPLSNDPLIVKLIDPGFLVPEASGILISGWAVICLACALMGRRRAGV